MHHKLFYFPILCLGLTACRYQPINNAFPQENTIKSGEKFCVNLPENHDQHENWILQDYSYHSARLINPVWHGNEKGIDFNFIAENKGTDTLTFVLRKYQDTLETRRFIVKVLPD
jgi:hypothetical protein